MRYSLKGKQVLEQSKPACREEQGQISPPAQTKVELSKFKPILYLGITDYQHQLHLHTWN